jgi:antitoxin VapB
MGLSIKNAEVERLARELAGHRKISITEAIRQSLEREVKREKAVKKSRESMYDAIMAIARESAVLPTNDDLTEDEILGYDEHGVPTR